jgi:hypothetical protein
MTEPQVELNLDINTASNDLFVFSFELGEFLAPKGITGNTYQLGGVNETSFIEPETNKEYFIDENRFDVLFQPTHSVGESAQLDIFFYGVRDKATNIRAAEPKELSLPSA